MRKFKKVRCQAIFHQSVFSFDLGKMNFHRSRMWHQKLMKSKVEIPLSHENIYSFNTFKRPIVCGSSSGRKKYSRYFVVKKRCSTYLLRKRWSSGEIQEVVTFCRDCSRNQWDDIQEKSFVAMLVLFEKSFYGTTEQNI